MSIYDLLRSQRRWGRTRCRRLLLSLGVREDKRIGTFTERQRVEVAKLLSDTRSPCAEQAPVPTHRQPPELAPKQIPAPARQQKRLPAPIQEPATTRTPDPTRIHEPAPARIPEPPPIPIQEPAPTPPADERDEELVPAA